MNFALSVAFWLDNAGRSASHSNRLTSSTDLKLRSITHCLLKGSLADYVAATNTDEIVMAAKL